MRRYCNSVRLNGLYTYDGIREHIGWIVRQAASLNWIEHEVNLFGKGKNRLDDDDRGNLTTKYKDYEVSMTFTIKTKNVRWNETKHKNVEYALCKQFGTERVRFSVTAKGYKVFLNLSFEIRNVDLFAHARMNHPSITIPIIIPYEEVNK